MNKIKIGTMLVAFVMIGSVLAVGPAAASHSVTVSQSVQGDTTVSPGDTVTVDVTIDADPGSPAIGGIDVPPGWSFDWVDTDNPIAVNGDELTWSEDLNSQNVHTVIYEVTVPSDASDGTYTLTANGKAQGPDSVDDDASDSDSLTITVEEPDQNDPPTADAGNDQTVDEGDTVELDASGSTDDDDDTLSYSWTTDSGVSLTDADTDSPTFTAPDVDSETTLSFEVEVDDGNGGTDNDTVNVTVQDVSEPDPANFQVSNLDAPDTATQDDAIDVSANITNDGDEEATQTVEFRLDLDGDGSLDGDEVLTSQDVTLDGDETETVTFEDIDTSALLAGDYDHGVFTDNDSETATITIEESDVSGPETSVSLSPDSSELVIGENESYDVVVDSADGGVGAYEATIALDDANVASITDVTLEADSNFTNVSYAEDNSSVTIRAALMDTDDTGSVSIASITVEGVAEGSSDLSVDVQALGNEDGESYTVSDENGASVSVIELPPLGEFDESPADPDGDGLYEDVNGDGEFNIVDIQALFANLDDETIQNNPDKFDFNEDGSVDVVDVQKLYTEVLL